MNIIDLLGWWPREDGVGLLPDRMPSEYPSDSHSDSDGGCSVLDLTNRRMPSDQSDDNRRMVTQKNFEKKKKKIPLPPSLLTMPEHDCPDPALILPDSSKRQTKRKERPDADDDTATSSQPHDSQKAKTSKKNKKSTASSSGTTREPTTDTIQPAPNPTATPTFVNRTPTLTPINSTPTPANSTPPPVNPAPTPTTTVIEVDDEETVATKLAHRLHMPGRPTSSCVADHPQFRTKDSLAYTFLIMRDPVHVDDGVKLVSCEMACALCPELKRSKWQWKLNGKGSTSNFLNHFKMKHTNVWKARDAEDVAARYPNRTAAPGEGTTQQPTLHAWADRAFDVPMADRLLSEWIVLKSGAFTDVEHVAFCQYVTHLRPGYGAKLIKADAAKHCIHGEFQEAEKRLKEYLKKAPGKKAFAADAWTSNNNLAYLAIVVCWITEDWEMASVLLDFPHLKGPHTGKNMAELLAKKILEYDLADQFSALAADNASNNDTLRQELASILNDGSKHTFYDSDEMTVRCLPHAIHLAVHAFLIELKAAEEGDIDPNQVEVPAGLNEEMAEEVVVQDEDIVGRSDEQLLGAQDNDGVDVTVVVQKAIDELCNRNDLYKKYKISSEEWDVVEVIVKFLEIFQECSEKMSSGLFPTLSASLLIYVKLIKAVNNFMQSETAKKNASVRAGLVACKEKLEKYFDKSTYESEYYYAAAVLDQRLKHKLFNANPDLFTTSWRQEMDTAFKTRLASFDHVINSTTTPAASATFTPSVSNTKSKSFNDLFNNESLLGSTASEPSAAESVEQEYARYLGTRHGNEDCLIFWKQNGKDFPRLAAYARDVLAIPVQKI
ncbi:hypothetical protein D9758_016791 [Tetrapyrgos nigripes]|uniref:HAT C-terminal dimerisation domain-containing protein n=1 Tax=Tetrapyrgos nigripes TaxID=182062 RepID=A0A8H5F4D8_9AGAR|nr:hypothetical protein D9758_016791 [Tetrapyrgos nigripes]